MIFAASNRDPVPANVVAARETAAAKAGAAVADALSKAPAARQALESDRAALKVCETELAALAHPGVEEDAIKAFRDRRETLDIKIDGFRSRIAAAESEASARDAEVTEARRALVKAMAELDDPTVADRIEDISRLKADAHKAETKAEASRASLGRAKQEGAPALAAYAAWVDIGANEAESLGVIKARAAAREKIAAAHYEASRCEEIATSLRSRIEAVEGEQDRKQRAATFEKQMAALQARRAGVAQALEIFDQEAERIARLRRTCAVIPEILQRIVDRNSFTRVVVHFPPLMLSPRFIEEARVASLDGERSFMFPQWTEDRYEEWEPVQEIVAPLRTFQGDDDFSVKRLVQATAAAIVEGYETAAHRMRECLAIEIAWRRERDAIFEQAGDAVPPGASLRSPLYRDNLSAELAPWKRLSLPSLRNSGEPFWRPDWAPERLLSLTEQAKAA